MARLERTFDFNMMASYEEFKELKVIFLHKWSLNKWTGETEDGQLIAINTSIGGLQICKADTQYELECSKFHLVGILKDNKSVVSASSVLSAKEICEFMSWEIPSNQIMDFIR